MSEKPQTVDEYIAGLPEAAREAVAEIRRTIQDTAPEVEESISYGIPTYKTGGRPLLYVAGWKQHVSLHAIPRMEHQLERQVVPYRSGKGTVRFSFEKAIPYQLIEQIIKALITN